MGSSNQDESRWVDERLDALAPRGFEPDDATARVRIRDRQSTAPLRRGRFWAVVAVTAALLVLLLPWTRAAAQRLWDRLTLARVEVVSVERRDVPGHILAFFQMEEGEPMAFEPVATVAEAERIAGFRPALPRPDVLRGTPSLAVVRHATLRTAPIRVTELRALLAAMQASDLHVPDAWDGAALTVEGGPIVAADYHEAGVQIMQAGPLRLTMPPGFELARFMEVAFRVFGRTPDEARRFGARVAANPPLLMVLTPGHHTAVREISFDGGTGMLVGESGGDGMCLFLNVPGRLYFISASELTEERALAIAASLE